VIMADEHWKDEPEAQDFPAAQSCLLAGGTRIRRQALKKEPIPQSFCGKDILRAPGPAGDLARTGEAARLHKPSWLTPPRS